MPRSPLTLPLLLTLAVAVAGVALPYGLLYVAAPNLERAPCSSGDIGSAAPDDAFYQAQQLTDLAARFPWTHRRAVALTSAVTLACMDTFASGCGLIRDDAIHETRGRMQVSLGLETGGEETHQHIDLNHVDWHTQVDTNMQQSFCGAWSKWIDWIDAQDLNAASACPVCAPTVQG